MLSQTDKIIAHLRAGNTLTPIEALRMFGTLRLGARIYELRKAGEPITADRIVIPGNRTIARYRLSKLPASKGETA